MNIYTRNLILKFINEGGECSPHGNIRVLNSEIDNIELMGNEEEVLSDYNVEIRGTLLNLLALYLGIDLKVIYGKKANQEQICEDYGSPQFPNKIEVIFTPEDKLDIHLSEVIVPTTKFRPQTPIAPKKISQANRFQYNTPSMHKTISEDVFSVRSQL